MKYQYTLYACQDTNISKNDPWDVNFENDQNIINFQPYKVDWFDYSNIPPEYFTGSYKKECIYDIS